MSTELDEAKLWYATAPDFDSYPEMLDAFHKHMLALASLPQQDAGEDRYTGEWENGFFVCRDMSKPEGSRIFYMSPESEAVWIERLNAAFAAGRSVPSEYVMSNVRPAVAWFAEQMEAALRRNDHKGGWAGMDHETLLMRCGDEMVELKHCWNLGNGAQVKGDKHIVAEAADVANFAMMIADNYGSRIGDALLAVPSPVGQAATVEQVLEEIQRWTWDHFKIQNKAMFENMRERLDPLFTHPPKAVVLTDENIKTIVAITFPNDTQTESIRGMEDGFAKGLRYARDNGYLSPKP